MTEEQIKQNAEKHFEALTTIHLGIEENESNSIVDAFIAGAHSRDEEIEKLKERIQILEEHACDVCINKMRHDKELDQLRNPWISVDEGLPEKLENDCVSDYVLTKIDGPRQVLYLVNKYNYAIKSWEGCNNSTTHWMPIPETPLNK